MEAPGLFEPEPHRRLEQLDGIAAVDGVDEVLVGAADLSASLGHLGATRHPKVVEAMERAIAKILLAGKAVGVLATDEAVAKEFLALGAHFVAVGVDTMVLAQATQALASRFKPDAEAPGAAGY